ncbi:MAG: hypothetical protein HY872_00515 [Chloroflexi bacterium]|nr:hypothetical protein [Chloroflexota bacterium]
MPVLPVAIPNAAEVKSFANHLHAAGTHWQGEIFGWQAEYTPERRKKPSGSRCDSRRQISGLARVVSGSIL